MAEAGAQGTVLVIGEALVDIVHRPDGTEQRHPGGSPANVALGLARLGHSVRFATRIGADDDGKQVREHLESDGVVLAEGSVVDRPTSTATAEIDERGAAAYTFELEWDLPPVTLQDIGHVHVGSIAASLEPGAARVREVLTAAHEVSTTSYDPNLRPRIIGAVDEERPRIEALVAQGDVVKVSDEDLGWLYPGEDVEQVAQRWLAAGPLVVVVTRGGEGSSAWLARDPGTPVSAAPRRVEVVDTVGAGDAFMSGLLSALLDQGLLGEAGRRGALREISEDDLRSAMQRATLTSSMTCERAGADPPTRAEL